METEMAQRIFTVITHQFPYPRTTTRRRCHISEVISALTTSPHSTRKDLEEEVDA